MWNIKIRASSNGKESCEFIIIHFLSVDFQSNVLFLFFLLYMQDTYRNSGARLNTECGWAIRRDLPLISPKCIHAGKRVAGWGLNREKTKMTGISPLNPFSRPLTHEWGQRERKERRGSEGGREGGREEKKRVDNQFVSNATKNWQV